MVIGGADAKLYTFAFCFFLILPADRLLFRRAMA